MSMSEEESLPKNSKFAEIFGDSDDEGGLSDLDNMDVQSDDEDFGGRRRRSPSPRRDHERSRELEDLFDENSRNGPSEDDDYESKSIKKLPTIKKRPREGEEGAKKPRQKKRISKELRNDAVEGDERQEEEENDPRKMMLAEIDRDFKLALAAGKSQRPRRRQDEDFTGLDSMMSELCQRMKNAAVRDRSENEARRPALEKLKLLDTVRREFQKSLLHEAFLENGVLEAIKMWLEPLPDRSLPSLDIQIEMMSTLDAMPITTDHLRESGVGKIVHFYTKCERIEPKVKRLATILMKKWSRPIIGLSQDYRSRHLATAEYHVDEDREKRRKDMEKAQRAAENEDDGSGFRRHAKIPMPVVANFTVVPQSVVSPNYKREKADDKYKKLKAKMAVLKSGGGKIVRG